MYIKRAFVEAAPHDEVVALARGDVFRRMKRPPVVHDGPPCRVAQRGAVCEQPPNIIARQESKQVRGRASRRTGDLGQRDLIAIVINDGQIPTLELPAQADVDRQL